MSAAERLGALALGWLVIIGIALAIHGINRLHERWTYRQHRRQFGRIPPRRTW